VIEGQDCSGSALIEPAMRLGARLDSLQTLTQARERARDSLPRLPVRLQSIREHADYPVHVGPSVLALAKAVDRRVDRVD